MFSAAGKSAVASGYFLNNSLRFRASATAYLNRTFATPTNNKIWTWSGWVKRSTLTTTQVLFSTSGDELRYISDGGASGAVDSFQYNLNTGLYGFKTNAIYRDVSAWYHIVVAVDTTQATAANRARIYINGTEASTDGTYGIVQNANPQINSAVAHNIGRRNSGSLYFDGYMTEINFVDGQQLTPSSFGETDGTTGVWKPKKFGGSYGTNGFYLPFSDIATTSGSNAGLGKDNSGNGNYWNTNNISVTAGTTYDAMTDVPTLTSKTVANYATFAGTNLGTYANATITEAGLRVSVSAGGTPDGGKAYAPFGMSDGSGKWYFEMTCVDPGSGNQRLCFGIANVTTNPNSTAITNAYIASASGAHGNYNIGTFTTNDVLQVAYDSGTNKLWFGKNNTWYNSGNPVAGTTPTATVTSGITYVPFTHYASSGNGPGIGAWNFGQRPFSYTPPTGFVALNTYNIPDSTIVKGNKYMDATLYTGTGATQTITNAGAFRPDLVWAKVRSTTGTHVWTDSNRGANKQLFSNLTNAEATSTIKITGFTSTGFTLGADDGTGTGDANFNGSTFVGWQWQAGQGSTSSNTAGSITSTVSVNATAGFSIVTYTGTGSAATVGHGLGVAPSMIIAKGRTNTDNWPVGHTSRGWDRHILLNGTAAEAVTGTTWNNTAPTSSVFSIGTDTRINQNTITYVAYCWAEIAGFSKFGTYTGNGSTDGPMIFTGFKPKWIMVKPSSTIGEWTMWDSSRDTYNVGDKRLVPNENVAEYNNGNGLIDFLSNGFKPRVNHPSNNSSGVTYIYACFAENPFKNSNAR